MKKIEEILVNSKNIYNFALAKRKLTIRRFKMAG